jgi:hypothetical protein
MKNRTKIYKLVKLANTLEPNEAIKEQLIVCEEALYGAYPIYRDQENIYYQDCDSLIALDKALEKLILMVQVYLNKMSYDQKFKKLYCGGDQPKKFVTLLEEALALWLETSIDDTKNTSR